MQATQELATEWNTNGIFLQGETTKLKLKGIPAIFYKKGVLKTVIGTTVFAISALALNILRKEPNIIIRNHTISGFIYPSIVSSYWIIHGLHLLYKGRSIQKGENKQVNDIIKTIDQLVKFVDVSNKEKRLINENLTNKDKLAINFDNLFLISQETYNILKIENKHRPPIISYLLENLMANCKNFKKSLEGMNPQQIDHELNCIFKRFSEGIREIEKYFNLCTRID